MKVIGFAAPGGPDVLRPFDIEEPTVGPGQVRVRVHAAAVNPSDLVTRSGIMHDRYSGVEPPYIPGWDAAGVIDEADPATGWKSGDEVIAITLPVVDGGGAYAEKIVVSAASITALPNGVGRAAASTLLMNGLTALQVLDRIKSVGAQVIAVTGGAGAIGGFVIELASRSGIRVIADAAPRDRPLLEALGADIVVDRGQNLPERILRHISGGVDVVVDAALLGAAVLPALRPGGTYLPLRTPEAGGYLDPGTNVIIDPVMVGTAVTDKASIDHLAVLAATGDLTLRVAQELPAHDAATAHRLLERGGVRGRLVLRF